MKTNAILRQYVGCLVWLFFSFYNLQAQVRVGQTSGALDGSAALDVSSGPYSSGSLYRGLLPPKVALTQTTQAAPITNPTAGLLVYNTASVGDVISGYYYWTGSQWARLSTTGAETGTIIGKPVPEYTIAQVRSLTAAPPSSYSVGTPIFMLIEEGREGLFRYAPDLTYADPGHPEWYAPDDGVMVLVTAGRSPRGDRMTYRRVYDGEINVRWFGAKGDGLADDSRAIQAAIDYARSKGKVDRQLPLFAAGGGFYRATVLIPEGNYKIEQTIDITNANGIVIKGVGGRYINTSLIGASPGAILDFTGSSLAGCENLTFTSYLGYTNVSSIGVLFALNGNGGVNCSIKNCYFQLADNPTANNNLGTIGILNCRAEEFSVTDCVIRANIGAVFSYKNSLADLGYNYTIQSAYTTIATGNGSMGVVNFSGQNAIQNYGLAQPGLLLNGTNLFNFYGYIGRASATGGGTNEAAILFGGPVTYNATINATIESFAQLMRVKSSLLNSTISGVVANQLSAGTSFPAGTTRPPVIDITGDGGGGQIHGCKFSITFGNDQAEINGRYLLYDGDTNASQLLNDEISCPQWRVNDFVASANLLSKAENTSFKTAFPFEKKSLFMNTVINAQSFSTSGWTTSTYNQIVPIGILSGGTVYIMKVIWGKAGVDQVVQSYTFPMAGTDFNNNPAAQVLPILTPNTVTFSNVGRAINVRYKAPTIVGQTSYGLEATINKSDMDGGTLTITIAPLL